MGLEVGFLQQFLVITQHLSEKPDFCGNRLLFPPTLLPTAFIEIIYV